MKINARKTTKKGKRIRYVLISLLLFAAPLLYGQGSDQSQSTLIKKAEQLFNSQDFQNALPLYAQLLSVNPEDPDFNYKFGVCNLFGDRGDKSRSVRYLKIAEKGLSDKHELNYHLGLAYYQNGDFVKAMQYLNLYLAKLSPNSSERPAILEKVNACLNGINLQGKELVAEVLTFSEFQKSNFHRAYRADEFNGMLLLKPEALNSNMDKKSNDLSFVFVSEPRDVVYFSSYGQEESNRNIYKAYMLEDGNWSEPELLPETVNSPFDEDYPVLMDNGTTLYFCSRGHNSIGGYDIYRTKIDTANNTFTEPENLGVGVNSPFDDILFILDKTGQNAYLTSDRDNLNGSVTVYKMRLVDNPFNEQQMYAQNQTIENLVKSSSQTDTYDESIAANPNEAKAGSMTKGGAGSNVSQLSDPSKRAEQLKNDLARNKQMADSAFLLVAQTKELIRDLTNERDRANAMAIKNEDLARLNEIEFEKIMNSLSTIADETRFEGELQKAVSLKKEILHYRTLADHSGIIARNLGKGLKLKKDELEYLKTRAGKIQSLAVTGTAEEAKTIFAEIKTQYAVADTLPDYSEQILTIARGNVKVEIPETELAFAEKMREDFHTETVIAATVSEKPKFDESVPIIVVDKRTGHQQEVEPKLEASLQKQVQAVDLIAPIYSENLTLSSFNNGEEELVISFTVDQVKPVIVPQEILYSDLALAEVDPDETLDINFEVDKMDLVVPDLVAPVETANLFVAQTVPEDEDIDINFSIDRVTALKVVEEISSENLAMVEIDPEDNLEVNLEMDKPELVVPNLVDPFETSVLLAAQMIPEDESLEIAFTVDQIEPIKLVETISSAQMAITEIDADENLDINLDMDKPDLVVLNLVDPVETGESMAAHVVAEDENLDIDFMVDQVEALKVVDEISPEKIAMAGIDPEESLEIDTDVDELEVVIPELVTPIETADLLVAQNIDENENLEINTKADHVDPIKIADEIDYEEMELIAISQNEILEINLEMEKPEVSALDLVEPISDDELLTTLNAPEIENINIDFEIDQIEPLQVVDPVQNTTDAVVLVISEEELQLNLEPETLVLQMPGLVETISTENLLASGSLPLDEKLEINFEVDWINAIKQAEEIEFVETGMVLANLEENLEINAEPSITEPLAMVEEIHPVVNENPVIIAQESIDINFEVDRLTMDGLSTTASLPYEELITFNDTELAVFRNEFSDKESIANVTEELLNEKEMLVYNTSESASAEIAYTIDETYPDQITPQSTSYYYLREAITYPEVIETSKTDREILELAMGNSDELTYEELLYAASIASDPYDQLAIYNSAFIHIDRDWRAYNNAAVTSLHVKDLNNAECYLNQASMITDKNEKVLNNFGVLACYKKDFDTARQHFMAASELGSISKYNLEVVSAIVTNNSSKENKIDAEVNLIETLGDIIDYTPNGND
jgi:Flp pilus assembly protein TadD